jgi:hypothetical protein
MTAADSGLVVAARGDGSSDDTQALQDALRSGGTLRLPRGADRITRPLEIALSEVGPVELRAEAGARLVMAGPGPALRIVGTHSGPAEPASLGAGVRDRERMPLLDGLEIAGEHPEADGIELVRTMQATLSRLLIRGCRHAIRLTDRNRNVIVSDVHLYHNRGVGLYLDEVNLHQINVIGCHISYNAGGGIVVRNSEVRNLQIVGNDIEYNYDLQAEQSADVWIDVGERSVREVCISGNTIQSLPSPGGANIRISGHPTVGAHKAGLVSITGNHLSSQEVNLHLQWARGVVVEGNTWQCGYRHSLLAQGCDALTIGANVFDHNPDYPKQVPDGLVLERCRGAQLQNFRIDRCLAGTPAEGASLEIRQCAEVTVTGVQILNPAYRGIEVLDSRHCMITGCHIRDTRSTPTMIQAIRVTGGGSNWVAHNLLSRGLQSAVHMEGGAGGGGINHVV